LRGVVTDRPATRIVPLLSQVAPLTRALAPQAAELLTESFLSSLPAGGVAGVAGFLRVQIRNYCYEHVGLVPRCLLLGATVVPARRGSGSWGAIADADAESDANGTSAWASRPSSGAAQPPILAAVGEVSFAPDTRAPPPPGGASLEPPSPGGELGKGGNMRAEGGPTPNCYLCNVATRPDARGRGLARRLVACLEEAAGPGGPGKEHRSYLHLRLRDDVGPGGGGLGVSARGAAAAPGRLWRGAGYAEVRTDGWGVRLLGVERRHLMEKRLTG